MLVGIPTEVVSGIVDVPFRCFTHAQIGTLKQVKWQDDKGGGDQTIILKPNVTIGPDDEYEGIFRINTSKEVNSGWRLWRFYAVWNHTNGNEHVARPRYRVKVANGKPLKDVGLNEGPTGWYKEKGSTDWGYLNAGISFDDRMSLDKAKFGTWSPKLVVSLNKKTGSPSLGGWSVHLDPDFHHGNVGTVLAEGIGGVSKKVPLDLSSAAPGVHKLIIRGYQQSGAKRHEGVGEYSFLVGQ
jgi:hypothetical protein